MKKLFVVTVLAVLLGAAVAGAAEYGTSSSELGGAVKLLLPGSSKYELYSMSYGFDVQYRYWFYEPFGVAFSLGGASYQVDGGSDTYDPVKLKDSSMIVIPIGPSGLFRLWDGETWSLSFEAGVRYVLANSDLELANGQTASVDNGVMSVVGLNFDWQMTEALSVFVGIEHIDDIVKGEVNSGRMRNNELQSFVFDFGAGFRF